MFIFPFNFKATDPIENKVNPKADNSFLYCFLQTTNKQLNLE